MSAHSAPRQSPAGRVLDAEAVALARPHIKQLERWHARVAFIGAISASGNRNQTQADYLEELDEIASEVQVGIVELERSLGTLARTSRGVDRVGAMRRLLVLIANTRATIASKAQPDD